MSGPTAEQVLAALRPVQDPELHRSLVDLGMIRDLTVEGGKVAFTVELTTPACPLKGPIRQACDEAVRSVEGVEEVEIRMGAQVRSGRGAGPAQQELIPEVKNVVLVGSGKGGVGKSTIATNLAVALGATNAATGLLDADIFGPSLPLMTGHFDQPQTNAERRLEPPVAHGIKVMSIGLLVDPDQAVVWRGPMVNSALIQLLRDVEWGALDYLVIDLPPGTGDVHLTLAQQLRATGAVIVSTPQAVALADAFKAKNMFDKVNIPVLGLVENMAWFACPGCGEEHAIFGRGGGARAAEKMGIPLLGSIPIDPAICEGGDRGEPLLTAAPDSPQTEAIRKLAGQVAEQCSKRAHVAQASSRLKVV